jgi:hypothetical protein
MSPLSFWHTDQYMCPKGHLQNGSMNFYVSGADSVTWRSGPVCSRCMADWAVEQFPTSKVETKEGKKK